MAAGDAEATSPACRKSRVRENRTPGSVRGRLGNWPSYRDGGASLIIIYRRLIWREKRFCWTCSSRFMKWK